MYKKALDCGLCPAEFWDMTLQEIEDTVNSRKKQKQDEIYTLSAMFRVAVLSVFREDVSFPAPPNENIAGNNWQNSKNYMKAVCNKVKKGGAKK